MGLYDKLYILLTMLKSTVVLIDNSCRIEHSKSTSSFNILIIGITESG